MIALACSPVQEGANSSVPSPIRAAGSFKRRAPLHGNLQPGRAQEDEDFSTVIRTAHRHHQLSESLTPEQRCVEHPWGDPTHARQCGHGELRRDPEAACTPSRKDAAPAGDAGAASGPSRIRTWDRRIMSSIPTRAHLCRLGPARLRAYGPTILLGTTQHAT